MYLHLFNRVTDALAALAQGERTAAEKILKQAQCDCEELYMDAPEGEDDKP